MKTLVLATFLFASTAHAESDAWITSKAKLALWTTSGVHSTRVHVDTIDGTITLYGSVDSAEQKDQAKTIASGIKGATNVRNLLQVVPPSQEKAVAASDKEISKAVEEKLKHDDLLSKSSVKVKSVDKGVVLLSGKADNMIDHIVAIQDADAVDGVRSVKSEIKAPGEIVERDTVMIYEPEHKHVSGHALADMRITTAVKMRLLADSDTPGTQINVDTSRSNVTLFGMVETEQAKMAAGADAKKVDGVKNVTNELQVVPANEKKEVVANDEEIKKRTQELLGKHDEYKDVSVDVSNGNVRLTGKVRSNWDRVHMATLTRATTGARAVHADVEIKK